MADTKRTFRVTDKGLKPSGPTFLDATSPTDGRGKVSFATTSTVISDAATKLKNSNIQATAKPKRKKKLMPLAEWNLRRENTLVGPQKNGLACPKCNEELYDMDEPCYSNMNGTFLRVACYCGWSGDRCV